VPLAKYFVTVGSALTVLLLIAGRTLPGRPANFPYRPEIIKRATIRIRSEQKWPDKVVLDTNRPMIAPPTIEVALPEQLVARLPEAIVDQAHVDPSARPNSDARPIDAHRPSAQATRRAARSHRSTHVAGTRNRSERSASSAGGGCCWAEWADRSAMSKATRKRVARHGSWTGWYFSEAN
jgi:hypothetical protein